MQERCTQNFFRVLRTQTVNSQKFLAVCYIFIGDTDPTDPVIIVRGGEGFSYCRRDGFMDGRRCQPPKLYFP